MALNLLKQNSKYGFLAAVILIWPFVSNIFLKTNLSYLSGKWSPWETFIVNPLQFLLLLILGFSAFKSKSLPQSLIALGGLIAGILSLILTPTQSTTTLVLLISFAAFLYLYQLKDHRTLKIAATIIFITQSIIAVGQFIFQHNLGLHFLNEPIINSSIKGIAKLPFPQFNTELIRSYGTFEHPNILGGFLSLLLIYFITSNHFSKRTKLILTILGCLALITTLSRSIIFLPIILLIYYRKQIKKIWLPLTLIILTIISIFAIRLASPYTTYSNQERLTQIENVIQTSQTKLLPWEQQPVHNIYLLLIEKYGIASLLVLILFAAAYYYKNKPKVSLGLIFLLLIGLTDHYLLTLPIGNYFVAIALLLSPTQLNAPETSS